MDGLLYDFCLRKTQWRFSWANAVEKKLKCRLEVREIWQARTKIFTFVTAWTRQSEFWLCIQPFYLHIHNCIFKIFCVLSSLLTQPLHQLKFYFAILLTQPLHQFRISFLIYIWKDTLIYFWSNFLIPTSLSTDNFIMTDHNL